MPGRSFVYNRKAFFTLECCCAPPSPTKSRLLIVSAMAPAECAFPVRDRSAFRFARCRAPCPGAGAFEVDEDRGRLRKSHMIRLIMIALALGGFPVLASAQL